MRVLVPGHRYELANLKSEGVTILQFFQDGEIHGGADVPGTSCQESLRALIDRIQVLDAEKPHWVNPILVQKGREMIALFEARALLRKAEQGLAIERLPIGADGHLTIGDPA